MENAQDPTWSEALYLRASGLQGPSVQDAGHGSAQTLRPLPEQQAPGPEATVA